LKFLIDAQVPKRLARWLVQSGHDAIRTLDLPDKNRTLDSEITRIALEQARVVVTKDDDFLHSYLIHRRPEYLLLLSTGNITNNELLALFDQYAGQLVEAFTTYRFVEMTRQSLLLHE